MGRFDSGGSKTREVGLTCCCCCPRNTDKIPPETPLSLLFVPSSDFMADFSDILPVKLEVGEWLGEGAFIIIVYQ